MLTKSVLCGDECESVSHTLWDCSAYRSIRSQFLLKLKASLGGSYARFEAMSSLELWEEHFESLLALVKAYIIDIWEEQVIWAQQPRPHSPTGILGKLLMGRIVKGCVREVSLAQVSYMFMLLRRHQWVRGLGATAAH